MICILHHTERCQNVCASGLFRLRTPVHGILYMNCGVMCSVVRRWNALFLHVSSSLLAHSTNPVCCADVLDLRLAEVWIYDWPQRGST